MYPFICLYVPIPLPVRQQVRVLNKEPKGKDVNESDVFHINTGFSEKLYRIKINSIQMKETEEENKKTNEQVRRAYAMVHACAYAMVRACAVHACVYATVRAA